MITKIITQIENYIIDIITSSLEFILWFSMSICKIIDETYQNLTKKEIIKSYIEVNNFIIVQNLILYILSYSHIVYYIIDEYTLFTLYSYIQDKIIYNFLNKDLPLYNLDIIETFFYII